MVPVPDKGIDIYLPWFERGPPLWREGQHLEVLVPGGGFLVASQLADRLSA